MYEEFFGLQQRPFSAVPLAHQYFPAAAIERARETLARTIERAEGAGLVMGPTGTGKTLLLRVLAEQYRDRWATVLLGSGMHGSRRALLQAILFELGLPYRGMDEGELRLSLFAHLPPLNMSSAGLLLLVDEAHTMSWRQLEELRTITDQCHDGEPVIRVVLAGSPRLEERFASPRLESFSQRLAARCYLEPFSREETCQCVRCQITAAGGDGAKVFSDDALESVYRATDGIPRLVNQLCDHALVLACTAGADSLSAAAIGEAWADLQQLPTPRNTQEPAAGATSNVVEFGRLDDAGDDLPEAIPFPADVKSPVLGVRDPSEQLGGIEATLAELEDAYQVAGSIGPELESSLSGPGELFGHGFQEEEIVLDRYAALDANLFASRPPVASQEGRELAARMARLGKKITSPAISVTGDASLAESPSRDSTSIQASACDGSMGEGDGDILIVEDDAGHETIVEGPLPAVRRLEYRKLFAKLRRDG